MSPQMTVEIGSLITRTPGVKGGCPCVAGTGVTVHRVAGWYQQGLSPEEIADQFGHLSLAQVHAALTYYHANREEVEALMDAEQREHDRLALEFLPRASPPRT